jgi:flagellin
VSFRINTNTSALTAHAQGVSTNRKLEKSLNNLSSGNKINKAADDASGLAIADSLRNQAKSLNQAIRNANDAIGLIQIADKAMDEQIKILDIIKVKAIQSAQDGQTSNSRAALQADIVRLMQELDNIATTTTYNGMSLLSGSFTNKEFQIGAYSNQTIRSSIGPTGSDKIGIQRYETGSTITAAALVGLKFKATDGATNIQLENVIISTSGSTGIGVLTDTINKNSNALRVRASWHLVSTGSKPVQGTVNRNDSAIIIKELEINNVFIGNVQVNGNDSNGNLVQSINSVTAQTGVFASTDVRGHLSLTSVDGRGINISGKDNISAMGIEGLSFYGKDTNTGSKVTHENYGRLTLTRIGDARDIILSGIGASAANVGFTVTGVAEASVSLRSVRDKYTINEASAMGFFHNKYTLKKTQADESKVIDPVTGKITSGFVSAGVTSLSGSQAVMDIVDSAITTLGRIRSDIGAVQNQLEVTINNISVTRTNVAIAESTIRDTDYAEETANFKKENIIAQAGIYAINQANSIQQAVLKLLQ